MYLEKIEEFEKEKKNVYMIRKQEESNLITLSKFLFKNININNTYNMKVVKYGDGFKFQFENAYLQVTQQVLNQQHLPEKWHATFIFNSADEAKI